MSFFAFATEALEKTVLSVVSRSVGEKIKDLRNERRMKRLVGEAVDRLAAQVEDYLTQEKLDDRRRQLLLEEICRELQPLVDTPSRLFGGDLEGQKIYTQLYPDGVRWTPSVGQRIG